MVFLHPPYLHQMKRNTLPARTLLGDYYVKNAKVKTAIKAWLAITIATINTAFISEKNYFGAVLSSFILSLVWAYIIGEVAKNGNKAKLFYAIGASIGTLTGLFIKQLLI